MFILTYMYIYISNYICILTYILYYPVFSILTYISYIDLHLRSQFAKGPKYILN